MKKVLFFLFFLFSIFSASSQTLETFEAATGSSFTSGGTTFNLSSPKGFVAYTGPTAALGYGGSNRFIHALDGGIGAPPPTYGQTGTITIASGTFKLNNFWIYLTGDNGLQTPGITSDGLPGTVTFRGKLGGVTQFTVVKTMISANITYNLPANGFVPINFATEGGTNNTNTSIDQLEVQLSSNYDYFAIDNFTFQSGATAPSITANPTNSTICAGANTTFSATASGATGYQWQVNAGSGYVNVTNDGTHSGANTATLTITGATAGMNGYLYRVVASSSVSPNATSTAGILIVNSAPAITAQPNNSAVCAGANTTFSATVSNATGYQWQVNDGAGFTNISNVAPYNGATTSTLTITGATTGMNGFAYRVVATGTCSPAVTSGARVLTVNPAPAITAQPGNSAICAGSNTTFSATVTNATGYQWQVDQGAGFSNIPDIAPYAGATTSTLSITGATAGMNGYVYRLVATGTCTPAAVSNGVVLTINSAPAITAQPGNSTICAGTNTTFSATVSNATGYQWQVNDGAGFTNISNVAPYNGATTSTLTITGATTGMNGFAYRVVATGTCSPTATSTAGTLTVNPAPAITAQPNNSTICAGGNTTFSATATNATGYQWQVNDGAGYINISDGAFYAGASTSTLTVSGATAGMNGYMYRVLATGGCTPGTNSNSATLTVNSAPAITAQPGNSTICAGGNTTFSATVTNATGYQWQVNDGAGFISISNGAPYTGATSSTLTITGVTAGMNGYMYRVIATGICTPAITSTAGTLTVNSAPAITAQPNNSAICAGANTTFSVTVSNATGYQWQVDQGAGFFNIPNIAPYSGATTSTLTITGATSGMNGFAYRVVATGTCSPTATSTAGTLTVNSAPAITAQPGNSTICAGGNTTFSATATNATGYQWQVNDGAGYINISDGAFYAGANTSTLTVSGATAGLNGYMYRVLATGGCTPGTNSNSATLTVNSAPAITAQPGNSTICTGGNTTFGATITNATGYQWQVDQGAGFSNIPDIAPYAGATTSTLTITGATAGMNGYVYRLVATGTCTPAAVSNSATLTINSAPAITAQPGNSTICAGTNTTFSATASNATGYQWQVNQGAGYSSISDGALYSGANTSTLTITGATANLNGYAYRLVATGACTPAAVSNSAILNINESAAITGQPVASTINALANAVFSVTASNATSYQWQENQGAGYANISNGGVYSGVTTANLNITAAPASMNGYSYRVVVSGNCSSDVNSNGVSLTVNKNNQNITFASSASATYGVGPLTLSASTTSGLSITYSSSDNTVATVSGNILTVIGAGTATITASQAGDVNYNAATAVDQTLTVNAVPLIITAENKTKPYGAALPVLTASYTGFVNGDGPASLTTAPTLSTTATASSPVAGNPYVITASGAVNPNYAISYVSGTLNITAVPLIITADNKSKTYGAALPALTASYSGFVNGDSPASLTTAPIITTTATAGSSVVGSPYTVTASGAVNSNYTISYMPGSLSITVASLIITADNITKAYGAALPALTASYSGFVNGDSPASLTTAPTLNTTATAGSSVAGSPYTVTASGAVNPNYTISYLPGNLSITAAALIITADNKTKAYGAALPVLTTSYSGFVNGDSPASLTAAPIITTTATAGSSVAGSPYAITLSGAVNPNYTISYMPGSLSITAVPLMITADHKTKAYGAALPALTASYSGFVNGDGPASLTTATTLSTTASSTSTVAAGPYPITASGAVSTNYTISYTAGTLTVTRAALTITADNKEKFAATANPPLTVTYSGFVNSETSAVLTTQPITSTTAVLNSPIGDYPITVSGAAAANYTISYVAGNLKIKPGAPTSITLAGVTLYENRTAGTNAGTLSSTSDDPSATFSYTLVAGTGDIDNALFTISGDKINTSASLNYENKSVYKVRVRATTQNALWLEKELSINLTDINEVPTLAAINNQAICFTTSGQTVALTGISAGEDAGQTTTLTVSSNNAALFESLTVTGSGATGTLNYRIKAGAVAGTATVTVTVKDNGGAANGGIDTYNRTFVITVNALPVVSISSDKGTTISKGDKAFLTATGGTTYAWANSAGVINGLNSAVLEVRPRETTTYTVTVKNASGCEEIKSFTLTVLDDFMKIKATNIMTPNGDGVNDKWLVDNIDFYPNNEVKIFDKAGRFIYGKKGYDNSWDGTLNGQPLAESTYYYIIDFGNRTRVMKGFITIVRND